MSDGSGGGNSGGCAMAAQTPGGPIALAFAVGAFLAARRRRRA
jgi:MYXO-CTERM domain-containing protein